MGSEILRHKRLVIYISKKVIFYLTSIFVAITFVFIIPRLVPGDPIQAMLSRMSQRGITIPGGADLVKVYRQRFGLDGDWLTQYTCYLRELFSGRLGYSIGFFPTTVETLMARALPWTISLLVVAVLISWALGNLVGLFIGWKRETKYDLMLVYIGLVLNQIPYYILALILVFSFAYLIPIFPTSGAYSYFSTSRSGLSFITDKMYHAILPSLSIIIVSFGGWMIGMRSMIVSVLGEDYLWLAEAKGLRKNVIMMKYAFRNALLPQITGLAMSLGFVMNGALLTEIIFAYPGVGYLLVTAVGNADYNLIQGILLLTITCVLIANLLIDLLYPLIDPRIRY